jgi:RNA polymerase sigma factor (TIGR02999 family)
MSDSQQGSVTGLLEALRAGQTEAFHELFPLVYGELHHLAAVQRRRWEGDETLNTTALVHEAYLRLVDQTEPRWANRAHFMAVAATAMRQILLDYAKRKQTAKHGGGRRFVVFHEIEETLASGGDSSDARAEALIALEGALVKMEQHNPRHSRIVECRFFGGMTIEDTAEALGLSPATVKRAWTLAQAWLYRELNHALADSR